MIARGLRLLLAIQALGVALCAYLLVRFGGFAPIPAALIGCAALLGVYALFVLATFAITWPRNPDAIPEQKIGFLAACRMVLHEWLAFFALFGVIQPFADAFFAVKGKRRPSSGQPPVMLVHGYRCNSGLWWWMAARLRAAGFTVEAIDLEPALASIDRFAEQLHNRIEAVLQDTGSAKVRIVTHSMGGLVARAYLRRYGTAKVGKLITLACGHHGTRIARLGLGQNAREMEPGSAWLAALEEPVPVPSVTVWAAQDNFIAPQTSSHLSGAEDIMLKGVGHLSFVFSRCILDIVMKELR